MALKPNEPDFSHPDVIETLATQERASAPNQSVWVSANAGSGKTHVLTQRVVRLLIGQAMGPAQRAAPEKIVCITYTKAAAAEMEARLYALLGKWTLTDDQELRKALGAFDKREFAANGLRKVRRLFAQALETPGGLKIQTIHSFCESILRRFPIEAGLLPGFKVDEAIIAKLQTQFLTNVAKAISQGDIALGEDLFTILEQEGRADKRDSVLKSLMRYGAQTQRRIEELGSFEAYKDFLREKIGLPPKGAPTEWRAKCLPKVNKPFLELMRDHTEEFKPNSQVQKAAHKISEALEVWHSNPSTAYMILASTWLTQKGKPRAAGSFGIVGASKVLPCIAEEYSILAEILVETDILCRAYPVYERAVSYARIAQYVYKAYTAEKTSLGLLDYDDLIIKTRQLLQTVDGAWVRYKLDQGIDHILLDEAQDTAAGQWSVIESFREEIFSAEPEQGLERTLFVVGDKKQSIYSFQGADAALFERKREAMATAIALPHLFREEAMPLSFRSAPAILTMVDAMFTGDAGQGVHGGEVSVHKSAKPKMAGMVEVWPIFPKAEKSTGEVWDLPVDHVGTVDAKRQLADTVCAKIKKWLDTPAHLLANGDPIEPKHILILCQHRKAQFYEIIQSLVRHNIPSGGADRVKLKEDIAVRDLLALLRFATNHEDDLSLAEALKSPLWGLTDEDLFTLTRNREGRSLWSLLNRVADGKGENALSYRTIIDTILRAEQLGSQQGPFGFLSALLDLGNPSGRQLFRRRLGYASDEALDELLNEALQFELSQPRSVPKFLAYLETLDTEIKKQAGDAGNVVRVMTVHGAKGLESPVVFLVDSTNVPKQNQDATIPLCAATGDMAGEPILGLVVPKPNESEATTPPLLLSKERSLNRILEEYRRKLYVAATRAEEQLYICGAQIGVIGKTEMALTGLERAQKSEPLKASWYNLSVQAMVRLGGYIEEGCPWSEDMPIMRYSSGEPASPSPAHPPADAPKVSSVAPQWLLEQAPTEVAHTILFPSQIDEVDENTEIARNPVAPPRYVSAPSIDPRQRGTLIHFLLQYLPAIAACEREAMAHRLLCQRAGFLSEDFRHEWVAEVLTILDDVVFAPVFTAAARAEITIKGRVGGKIYSGQIDRLVVKPDEIYAIDYKTHRPPPKDVGSLSPEILHQMQIYRQLLKGLYPGRRYASAILWTHAPCLMPIPDHLLGATD